MKLLILITSLLFTDYCTASGVPLHVLRSCILASRRYSSASSAIHTSDIVSPLKRVLTAGENGHRCLEPDHRQAFFYSHLLQRWNTSSPEIGKDFFKSYPDTEFEKFHSALADRLSRLPDALHKTVQVGLHAKNLEYTSTDETKVDSKLVNRINKDSPFIDGQIITLKGKTTFPLNFFTLSEKGSCFVNFATPVQNGFYFQNLRDYYKYIALLRSWGAYRDLKIISIPSETNINCRVGLVAPQQFPNTRKIQYYVQNNQLSFKSVDIRVLEDLQIGLRGSLDSSFHSLIEDQRGGEVQFMFGYVEKYNVYDCGPLCLDSNGRPKEYIKKQAFGSWVKPRSAEEHSHFLDPDYLKTPFHLENILHKIGAISSLEKEEILKFLREKKIRLQPTEEGEKQ